MSDPTNAARRALDEHIARVRALPGMAERAAPAIARAAHDEVAKTASAGTAPDGAPWKPTKDGTRAMRNAAAAVRAEARGSVVLVSVEGHHALHHLGRAKGGVRRQIIPTRSIPTPVTNAIETVLAGEFRKTMGGGA